MEKEQNNHQKSTLLVVFILIAVGTFVGIVFLRSGKKTNTVAATPIKSAIMEKAVAKPTVKKEPVKPQTKSKKEEIKPKAKYSEPEIQANASLDEPIDNQVEIAEDINDQNTGVNSETISSTDNSNNDDVLTFNERYQTSGENEIQEKQPEEQVQTNTTQESSQNQENDDNTNDSNMQQTVHSEDQSENIQQPVDMNQQEQEISSQTHSVSDQIGEQEDRQEEVTYNKSSSYGLLLLVLAVLFILIAAYVYLFVYKGADLLFAENNDEAPKRLQLIAS